MQHTIVVYAKHKGKKHFSVLYISILNFKKYLILPVLSFLKKLGPNVPWGVKCCRTLI